MKADRKSNTQPAPPWTALPDFPKFPEIEAYDKEAPAKMAEAQRSFESWWRDVVRLLSEEQQSLNARIAALEDRGSSQ